MYMEGFMTTPAARKRSTARRLPTSGASRTADDDPIIVYVGTSLDGTTFALDPLSQQRVRDAFPNVHVSTRHVFIAHDTREDFEQSVGRFEDQLAALLTGVTAERLAETFSFVSFRDPKSDREIGRIPAKSTARVARRA